MNHFRAKNGTLDELVAQISEYLVEGELALFCGAGISKNSGLPLANDLKRNILEALLQSKKEVKQVMKAPCPFESFMQYLFHPYFVSDKNLQVTKIFDIFHEGVPNSNHMLIAHLAKSGLLKTIATTNFDVLIERGLSKTGCTKGVNFEKYYREEDFAAIDFDALDDKLSFFKLHGSIDNLDSIRTTIAAVASKTLSEKRMNVVRHLFSSGEHKAVLVIGYSCSDTFDIIPQILSIKSSGKQVFFVKHCRDPNTFAIKTISREFRKNPFRHYPGKWILCNTDSLIKTLWKALEDSIGNYELIRSDLDWSRDVSNWLGKSKENVCVKSFVAGWVLEEMQSNSPLYSKAGDIQLSEKARSYYARALDLAESKNHIRMMMVCNLEMGRICLYKKASTEKAMIVNYKRAIDYFCEAIRLAASQSSRDESFIAASYHALGVTRASLREPDTARDYLQKSRKHYRRLANKREVDEGLSNSYTEEGVIYGKVERRHKKALECYEKARDLLNGGDCDKSGGAGFCITFGNAYLWLRENSKAIGYYEKAKEMSERRGDIYTLNVAYKCLSDVYRVIGDDGNYNLYIKKLTESEAKIRGFQ
jgi:tetratricopeptide (TPR) repeat protein/NAD-dependent SIR2 family protein deacetylase